MKTAADLQLEIEDTLRLLDADLDQLKRKIQPPRWVSLLSVPLVLLFLAVLAAPLLPGHRRRMRHARWSRALRNLRHLRSVRKLKPTRFRDQLRLAFTVAKVAARGRSGIYVVS